MSVLSYSELKDMISKDDIQLFDVRNPDEFEAGSIPKAVNIPLGTLEDSLKLSAEDFEKKFKVKAPGKEDKNIVFSCRSGIRSSSALKTAHNLGFRWAKHYGGGYTDWVKHQKQ